MVLTGRVAMRPAGPPSNTASPPCCVPTLSGWGSPSRWRRCARPQPPRPGRDPEADPDVRLQLVELRACDLGECPESTGICTVVRSPRVVGGLKLRQHGERRVLGAMREGSKPVTTILGIGSWGCSVGFGAVQVTGRLVVGRDREQRGAALSQGEKRFGQRGSNGQACGSTDLTVSPSVSPRSRTRIRRGSAIGIARSSASV